MKSTHYERIYNNYSIVGLGKLKVNVIIRGFIMWNVGFIWVEPGRKGLSTDFISCDDSFIEQKNIILKKYKRGEIIQEKVIKG